MIDILEKYRYNILDFGVWRSLVSRLVRVQEASGSNPDTPTKNKRAASAALLFLGQYRDSKGRHQSADWCKKVSGGHFFSPWENPLIAGRIQYGCVRQSSLSDLRSPQMKHRSEKGCFGSPFIFGQYRDSNHLNADVRWTSAWRVGPRQNLKNTSQREVFCNESRYSDLRSSPRIHLF